MSACKVVSPAMTELDYCQCCKQCKTESLPSGAKDVTCCGCQLSDGRCQANVTFGSTNPCLSAAPRAAARPVALPSMAWGAPEPMDDSSDDDEEVDMNTLRRQAKEASLAVLSNGGLPDEESQRIAEKRSKGPWASMMVLSDALGVLDEIVSQPREAWTINAKAVPSAVALGHQEVSQEAVSDAVQVGDQEVARSLQAVEEDITSTPRISRPTSARSSLSRPTPRRNSRALATRDADLAVLSPKVSISSPLLPSTASGLSDTLFAPKMSRTSMVLGEISARPASPAVLPPVKTPAKMSLIDSRPPRPASLSTGSAMEMDLGFGAKLHTTPPQRRRQSQSLGSLPTAANPTSRTSSNVMLPSLAKVSKTRLSSSDVRSPSMDWGRSVTRGFAF